MFRPRDNSAAATALSVVLGRMGRGLAPGRGFPARGLAILGDGGFGNVSAQLRVLL